MRPEYLAVLALIHKGEFNRYWLIQRALGNDWMESGAIYLDKCGFARMVQDDDARMMNLDYRITDKGAKLVHDLMDFVSP